MKAKKGNWVVRAKCIVTKDVYVSDCTEEEAKNDPFNHADDQIEVDQLDWEVQSVLPCVNVMLATKEEEP